MKNSYNKVKKKFINYFKTTPFTDILIKRIFPVLIYTLLVMLVTVKILSGLRSGSTQRVSELQVPIASTVDLPTQVKELQLQQSLVLEKQLDNISVSTNQTADISEIITQFNQKNEIDSFLDDLISLNYKDNIDTQYRIIKKYLSGEGKVDSKTTIEEETYRLLGDNNWSKETKSKSAKTGTSLISILNGSNKDYRFYQVIVPATNENREMANLIYFIKTDNNGKIQKCLYGGVLENSSKKDTYKEIANLYNE